LDGGVPGVAGIVDEDIEPFEVRQRSPNEAIGKARFRDAAIDRNRLAARGLDLGGNRIARRGIEIVDHELRALARELQRNGAANAAAGAGDECDFSLQFGHWIPSLTTR